MTADTVLRSLRSNTVFGLAQFLPRVPEGDRFSCLAVDKCAGIKVCKFTVYHTAILEFHADRNTR